MGIKELGASGGILVQVQLTINTYITPVPMMCPSAKVPAAIVDVAPLIHSFVEGPLPGTGPASGRDSKAALRDSS